jgi:hypothetical protein
VNHQQNQHSFALFLIVGNPENYYIFSNHYGEEDPMNQDTPFISYVIYNTVSQSFGASTNLVDASGNQTEFFEGMCLVPSPTNVEEYWLITRPRVLTAGNSSVINLPTTKYFIYRVNSSGVSYHAEVNLDVSTTYQRNFREVKGDRNGNIKYTSQGIGNIGRLGFVVFRGGNSSERGSAVYTCDFDASTGNFVNVANFDEIYATYGSGARTYYDLEFSPNGSKLYFSTPYNSSSLPGYGIILSSYDFNQPNQIKTIFGSIPNTNTRAGGGLKLASDGNIYHLNSGTTYILNGTSTPDLPPVELWRITNPNSSNPTYEQNVVSANINLLPNGSSNFYKCLGLPEFAVSTDVVVIVGGDSISCDSPSTTINVLVTANNFTVASYQWYLNGVPITGAINDNLTVNQEGIYFVEVTSDMGCVIRSNTHVVRTFIPNGDYVIGSDTLYCGESEICFEFEKIADLNYVTVNGILYTFNTTPSSSFCETISVGNGSSFVYGNNEICAYFISSDSVCFDTVCINIFIEPCDTFICDYNPIFEVSEDSLCENFEFQYVLGPAQAGLINIYLNGNNIPFISNYLDLNDPDYNPLTGMFEGLGDFNGLPSGSTVLIEAILFETDSLGCSDTLYQTLYIGLCDTVICDYNPSFIVSDSNICDGEEFLFSFGPAQAGFINIYLNGNTTIPDFSNYIDITDPDYNPLTGMFEGIGDFNNFPYGTIVVEIIAFETDSFGCSENLFQTFVFEDCDSTCEEYEGLAESEISGINGLTAYFTDITENNGPTPDYVIWLFPGQSITANANETVTFNFPSNGTYVVCMVAAWLHNENSLECCFDTTCLDTIIINDFCDNMNITQGINISIDPFDDLHYYFENTSTPAPANVYMWSIDGGSFVVSADNTFDAYFQTQGSHQVVARTIWHLNGDMNQCCIRDFPYNFVINDSINCSNAAEFFDILVSPNISSPFLDREYTLNYNSNQVLQVNSVNWQFGDGTHTSTYPPNITDPIFHQYINPGIYDVSATIDFIAVNGVKCVVTIYTQIKVTTISLAPNPASNKVMLSFYAKDANEKYELQVTEMNGKVMFTKEIYSTNSGLNEIYIQLDNFSVGIYQVKLSKNKELVGIEKLVKY